MKKLLSLVLALTLLLGTVPTNFSYAANDAPSSWAKSAIENLISKGAIPSHLQNNYQKAITRKEFSQLLVPILSLTQREMGLGYEIGKKEPWGTEIYENLTIIDAFESSFNFEKSDKFIDCNDVDVYKLAYKGIIKGTSTVKEYYVGSTLVTDRKFEPNALITREQASIMMVNTINWNNQYTVTTEKPQGYKFLASYKPITFGDKGSISNWALGYVTLAVNNELITGVGNNKFNPKGNLTREQAMVMGYRIYTMFTQDSGFYDRVSKSNSGYIFDKDEPIKDSPVQGIYTPVQLALDAVSKGITTKRGETVVTKPTTPTTGDLGVSGDGRKIYFVGDVITFIGKNIKDFEKVFGGNKPADKFINMWGLTSYYFADPNIGAIVDKSGTVVGVNYLCADDTTNNSTGYNIFGDISWNHTQDYLRKNFKVLKEGKSRRDLLGLYRMYLDYPGYMVEICYSYEMDLVTPSMDIVNVLKGDYIRTLDYLQAKEY